MLYHDTNGPSTNIVDFVVLSVEPRKVYGVSNSLGRAFPNKVYATREIRACRITVVQPLQG